MPSVFSKIVNGEIASYKIAETADYLAFLDVNPLAEGHVLVIPKKEVDNIFDIEDELYNGLFAFAKQVAHAIKLSVPCRKVGMAVIGLEVAHAHIHLVPINSVSDINFSLPKLKIEAKKLEEMVNKIKAAYTNN